MNKKHEKFKQILLEYNQKVNLTAITEQKEIDIKHFYDSLYAEKYIPQNAQVADIGSGGGFPAIPLCIQREDIHITLIESVAKKCAFLEYAVKELGLKNAKIVCGRAEILAKEKEYREKFDIVTARAVAKLNTLSEYCIPFVKVNGLFIAYKAIVSEEIESGKNAVNILGGEVIKIEEYVLPEGMGTRTLIVSQKRKPTPAAYPRGMGKERSKPLGENS